MKTKKTKPFGGVPVESVFLAAGFCAGLATRNPPITLSRYDKRVLKIAGKALMFAAQAHRNAQNGGGEQ